MNALPHHRPHAIDALVALASISALATGQTGAFPDVDALTEDRSFVEQLSAAGPLAAGSYTTSLSSPDAPQSDLPVWEENRSDRYPPMGYKNTRMVRPEQIIFDYQLEYRRFKGMRDSRDTVSSSDIFDGGATFAPTEMTWITHDLQMLYGIRDDWTVSVSLPVIDKDMDIDLAAGGSKSLTSSGLGDLRLGATTIVKADDYMKMMSHFAISFPTGNIDETDSDTPLPYPMQLGTGTLDIFPGITQMWQGEDTSWGFNTEARLHVGRNQDNYGVSDTYFLGGWWTRSFTPTIAGSLRLEGTWWGDYHGRSDTLDPTVSPVNDKFAQGGTRIDLFGGGEWDLGDYDRDQRLGLEVGVPIDEWLDGPQLATHMIARLAWRISF